jgi:hypothetical protein
LLSGRFAVRNYDFSVPLPFQKQTASGNPVIAWQHDTLRSTIDWLTIDIDLDDKGKVC